MLRNDGIKTSAPASVEFEQPQGFTLLNHHNLNTMMYMFMKKIVDLGIKAVYVTIYNLFPSQRNISRLKSIIKCDLIYQIVNGYKES